MLGIGATVYIRYGSERLKTGPFGNTVSIYTAPIHLAPGDPLTAAQLIEHLRGAGYGESKENRRGFYISREGAVEIHPGPESAMGGEPVVVRFNEASVSAINGLDGESRGRYRLDPELIANVSERSREKRRLMTYSEIPPQLVKSIVAAEDKRFFSTPDSISCAS